MVASTMGVLHVRRVRTGLEEPDENVAFDPVAVALEDRVPVAKKAGRSATAAVARSTAPLRRAAIVTPLRPGFRRLPRQCAHFAHWASVSTNRSIQSLNHNHASAGILILNRP